jgi:hypothetical protein
MDSTEAKLRTMGEVITDGWHLFLRAFSRVFPLALLAQWVGLLNLIGSPSPDSADALAKATSAPQFLLWLATWQVQMFFLAAIINEVGAVAEGHAGGSVGDSLKNALRQAVPLLIATAVFWVGVSVGLVFLLIPGFIVGAYLLFFPYTLVIEGRGPLSCLGASLDVVDGSFWRAGVLLSVPTLGYLVSYAVQTIPAAESAMAMIRSGKISFATLGGPKWFQYGLMPVLLALSATLLWTMAYPIYTDLKQRKADARRR